MYNNTIYNSNDNGQRASQHSQGTQTTGSILEIASTVLAIVGGVLLGVGILVFSISFFVSHSSAILSLQITGGVLAFTGLIELTISAIFRSIIRSEQANLTRLKLEGDSFLGEITQIHRQVGVHVGTRISAHVDCSYTNSDGNTYFVRSKSFLYHPTDNLHAWVHVNPHNPRDYAVEVFTHF